MQYRWWLIICALTGQVNYLSPFPPLTLRGAWTNDEEGEYTTGRWVRHETLNSGGAGHTVVMQMVKMLVDAMKCNAHTGVEERTS